MAQRSNSQKAPLPLDFDTYTFDKKDREIVESLVRVYQTYAWSLSLQEQREYRQMIRRADYSRRDGRRKPDLVTQHHVYRQMYDRRKGCWLREEVTFAKWALLAILYPSDSLNQLAKVVCKLGIDKKPRWQEYADYYDQKEKKDGRDRTPLELPDAPTLAARCRAIIQISRFVEVKSDNDCDGAPHAPSAASPTRGEKQAASLPNVIYLSGTNAPDLGLQAQNISLRRDLARENKERAAALATADYESIASTKTEAQRGLSSPKHRCSDTGLELLQRGPKRQDAGREVLANTHSITIRTSRAPTAQFDGQETPTIDSNAELREVREALARVRVDHSRDFARISTHVEKLVESKAQVEEKLLQFNQQTEDGQMKMEDLRREDLNTKLQLEDVCKNLKDVRKELRETNLEVEDARRERAELRRAVEKLQENELKMNTRFGRLKAALHQVGTDVKDGKEETEILARNMDMMQKQFADSIEDHRDKTTSSQRRVGEAVCQITEKVHNLEEYMEIQCRKFLTDYHERQLAFLKGDD
ncbi:hypothetical protein V2A60_007390 [Cordyceps javanica]